ncbi:MAG: hypothetical protein R3263_08915 [Myxococcota bacterium]|nr:hypothetical protein [Myxococcota bacterium]
MPSCSRAGLGAGPLARPVTALLPWRVRGNRGSNPVAARLHRVCVLPPTHLIAIIRPLATGAGPAAAALRLAYLVALAAAPFLPPSRKVAGRMFD